MSLLLKNKEGDKRLLMGNEAIARGAIEAGLAVATGYPGTPSSEIIENLSRISRQAGIYVEWSVNEKVAAEAAAAASFAGLRSLCVMKQNGVNVASDFLLHLAESGTRGGMVLVPCDDPGALSSVNEGDARFFARMLEVPLLEPGDFQEAKDMTRWAFALSEEIRNFVVLRSVTRLSHASGMVSLGKIPRGRTQAQFRHAGALLDPESGPMISCLPGAPQFTHRRQQDKIRTAREIFETSPFNYYEGPRRPEVLIVASSICSLYSREAIAMLGKAGKKCGLLKMGTTWPLPEKFLQKHLSSAEKIVFVEEVLPFLEENVLMLAGRWTQGKGPKSYYGKNSGTLPSYGEMNPDLIAEALEKVLAVRRRPVRPESFAAKAGALAGNAAPRRELTFCPGCPHRASFWSIHSALKLDGREGFVCGDIGCYTLAAFPTGFNSLRTVHSMGSGAGLAGGFGRLRAFGLRQPILAVCGDSTFFHAAIPALINAVHHQADLTMVILDNRGTAMTGFQPHPGLPVNAMQESAPPVEIENICRGIGVETEIRDPFDLKGARDALLSFLEKKEGARVLILRQACSLSPEKKKKSLFKVRVDENACRGERCGCNRLCTRIFRCPGLYWDNRKQVARIDDVVCAGCGVCASICPAGAILKEDAV